MSPVWRAALPAAAVFACASLWALLSSAFRYGEGHAQRPIGAFVLLWLAAGLALWLLARALLASTGLKAEPAGTGGPPAASGTPAKAGLWGLAFGLALLSRLVLLPTPLIQEDDPYRYVLDGNAVLAGSTPYRLSPLEVGQSFHHPLTPDLRSNAKARRVLERVSHPHLKTVYPPVSQAAFAVGAWVGGWDWQGQRWVFLTVDLAVLTLLLALLGRFQLPLQWSLLWACNPLVLKEVANSAHVDVLAAFFLLLAVGLARQAALPAGGAMTTAKVKAGRPPPWPAAGQTAQPDKPRRRWAATGKGLLSQHVWAALAALALALSVLSKPYTACLLPAFLFWMFRQSRPCAGGPPGKEEASSDRDDLPQRLPAPSGDDRNHLRPVWTFSAAFLLAVLPGALLMLPSAQGLQAYSTQWGVNGGAYSVIEALAGMFSAWAALPRLAAVVLTASLAVAIPLRSRAASFPSWISDLQRILLLSLLLLPALYPWYALPLLALLPLAPAGRSGRATLALCAVIGVYYLHFLPGYREASTLWIGAATLGEHALIWLFLLWTPQENR